MGSRLPEQQCATSWMHSSLRTSLRTRLHALLPTPPLASARLVSPTCPPHRSTQLFGDHMHFGDSLNDTLLAARSSLAVGFGEAEGRGAASWRQGVVGRRQGCVGKTQGSAGTTHGAPRPAATRGRREVARRLLRGVATRENAVSYHSVLTSMFLCERTWRMGTMVGVARPVGRSKPQGYALSNANARQHPGPMHPDPCTS